MTVDVKDLMIRSLAEEMYAFDTAIDRTSVVRSTIINKLEEAVSKIDDISFENAEVAQTKLSVITTTLRALSDQETSAAKRVTTKIRHQENARSDATSENVIKLIQTISQNRASGGDINLVAPDLSQVSLDLERSLREAGETIEDTELRFDPDDLS